MPTRVERKWRIGTGVPRVPVAGGAADAMAADDAEACARARRRWGRHATRRRVGLQSSAAVRQESEVGMRTGAAKSGVYGRFRACRTGATSRAAFLSAPLRRAALCAAIIATGRVPTTLRQNRLAQGAFLPPQQPERLVALLALLRQTREPSTPARIACAGNDRLSACQHNSDPALGGGTVPEIRCDCNRSLPPTACPRRSPPV